MASRIAAESPHPPRARGAAPDTTGRAPHRPPIFAALDLGTNNCRLLMAAPRNEGFRVVGSYSRIVRLGEGLATAGRISDAAIQRTLAALAVCAGRIRGAGARHVRCVATEACRRAENGGAFLARAKAETGLDLEPITIEEEAALTLSGCASLVDPRFEHVLLFDIGGGSTEVIWARREGNATRILALTSIPVGVVTLSEQFGGHALCPESYARIAQDVTDRVSRFDAEHGIARQIAEGGVQMIGTSGTVTTLGAFTLGLGRYQRDRVDGLDLTFDQMAAANEHLKGLDFKARADHPCIGPERADLVLAGCAILEAICRQWRVGRLRIADRGIREGLLQAMMADAAAGAETRPAP